MRIFGELQEGAGFDSVEDERLRLNLASVKSILAIASPKGGSGKSIVAVNLAAAFSAAGKKVGILDADLNAPSVLGMLGVRVPTFLPMSRGIDPASGPLGIRVVSSEFLAEVQPPPPISFVEIADSHPAQSDEPEEMSHAAAVRRMLTQTRLDNLDVLLIDLAPGLDRLYGLAKTITPTGVLLVMHPAMQDARVFRRIVTMREELALPILAVVENMVGFYCNNCHSVRPLFPGGEVSRLARESGVEVVARLPFDPRFAESADRARLFLQEHGDTPMAKQIGEMARRVNELLDARSTAVRARVASELAEVEES